jgi:RNA polymerase sigma factor (sigma-70 family)
MLGGDRGRAEDLVQYALLKTYLAWRRVATGNPEAYARTVVRHTYVDWWRRRPWRETPTDQIPERRAAIGQPDHADTLVRRDTVLRALAQLTPRERGMVSLRHLYGLSEADTSAAGRGVLLAHLVGQVARHRVVAHETAGERTRA